MNLDQTGHSEFRIANIVIIALNPGGISDLPFLDNVSGNFGSAVVDGRRPGQCHVISTDGIGVRGSWRSRRSIFRFQFDYATRRRRLR